MKYAVLATSALTLSALMTEPAAAGPRQVWDRIEDRIDRRESILDERVDHGRRDVIEDRLDRIESRRDRAGKPSPRWISAWERRSWRARWGRN